MSKPRIHATCDAGCKWETIHKTGDTMTGTLEVNANNVSDIPSADIINNFDFTLNTDDYTLHTENVSVSNLKANVKTSFTGTVAADGPPATYTNAELPLEVYAEVDGDYSHVATIQSPAQDGILSIIIRNGGYDGLYISGTLKQSGEVADITTNIISSNNIKITKTPSQPNDAVRKDYVDAIKQELLAAIAALKS